MSTPFGADRIGPGVAGPRVEAPTKTQGPPETREKHHSIIEYSPARRKLLLGLFGIGGAAALGGVGYALTRGSSPENHPASGGGAGVLPESSSPSPFESPTARGDFDVFPRVYEKELTRDEIVMPTHTQLDAKRVEDSVPYIAQAIQYCVNKDPQGIYNLVTGGYDFNAMEPDQLLLRAAYIQEHNGDGIADHPPTLPSDYAWGFQMRPLKMVETLGDLTTLEVEVTIGDYRPNNATVAMEPPKKYTCLATFVHQDDVLLGPDRPTSVWGIYRLDRPRNSSDPALPPPPKILTDDMPAAYSEIPPLYPAQIK